MDRTLEAEKLDLNYLQIKGITVKNKHRDQIVIIKSLE